MNLHPSLQLDDCITLEVWVAVDQLEYDSLPKN